MSGFQIFPIRNGLGTTPTGYTGSGTSFVPVPVQLGTFLIDPVAKTLSSYYNNAWVVIAGGAGVTPTLDQVLTAGNSSTQTMTVGALQVTGGTALSGALTVSGTTRLLAVANYVSGSYQVLVLNSTTGNVEKTTISVSTPTLDQVLTAGNTSTRSITTGNSVVNGTLNVTASSALNLIVANVGTSVTSRINNTISGRFDSTGTTSNLTSLIVDSSVLVGSSGTVPNMIALDIEGPYRPSSGGGAVTNAYAIYLNATGPTAGNNAGTTQYCIYQNDTNRNRLGGDLLLPNMPAYASGGFLVVAKNATTGRLETIVSGVTPTLDQVLTAGNTSLLGVNIGTISATPTFTASGGGQNIITETYTGTGGTTFARGLHVQAQVSATSVGVVAEITSLYVDYPIKVPGSTSTFTNVYGIYISNPANAASGSNTYGIYQANGQPNVLNGQLLLTNVGNYSAGGFTPLVLNATSGKVEKNSAAAGVTGTGVANNLAVWTSPSSIGDTAITVTAGPVFTIAGGVQINSGLTLLSIPTYTSGGFNALVLNATSGAVNKISGNLVTGTGVANNLAVWTSASTVADSNVTLISSGSSALQFSFGGGAGQIGVDATGNAIFYNGNVTGLKIANGAAFGIEISATNVTKIANQVEIDATAGNIKFDNNGTLDYKASGGGATAGRGVVLVAGTATVNTTAVAATSIVLLSRRTTTGTVGEAAVIIVPGTSFSIASSSALDTSTFDWVLINTH